MSTQRIVNRMTNWQRHQWAKAGYKPGRAAEFAALQRPIELLGVRHETFDATSLLRATHQAIAETTNLKDRIL